MSQAMPWPLSTAQEVSGSTRFVRSLDLRPCNASYPSSVRIAELTLSRTNTMAQSDIDKFASVIPVGRMCTPEDVAGAVAYLVSPEAKFITGVNLQVCLILSDCHPI